MASGKLWKKVRICVPGSASSRLRRPQAAGCMQAKGFGDVKGFEGLGAFDEAFMGLRIEGVFLAVSVRFSDVPEFLPCRAWSVDGEASNLLVHAGTESMCTCALGYCSTCVAANAARVHDTEGGAQD